MIQFGEARRTVRQVVGLLLVGLLLCGACSKPDNPLTPGVDVNTDPDAAFAKLKQLPDIEEATKNYNTIDKEIRESLTKRLPVLSSWTRQSESMASGCSGEFRGINGKDGETRQLDFQVVAGNLPDGDYEIALSEIGRVAEKYGFDPKPLRLHDAPSSHDAEFHNKNDGGKISFGTGMNTTLDLSIGCHLTAQAKARGTRSDGSR